MKITVPSKIVDGKLEFSRGNRLSLSSGVASLGDGGCVVSVEKTYKKRSLAQNAYYWSVVVDLYHKALVDLGWDISLFQTHEYLLNKFSREIIVNTISGEVCEIVKRSSKMTTVEINDYINMVCRDAAEMGIVIPEPNE